jgi:hypothetical protein
MNPCAEDRIFTALLLAYRLVAPRRRRGFLTSHGVGPGRWPHAWTPPISGSPRQVERGAALEDADRVGMAALIRRRVAGARCGQGRALRVDLRHLLIRRDRRVELAVPACATPAPAAQRSALSPARLGLRQILDRPHRPDGPRLMRTACGSGRSPQSAASRRFWRLRNSDAQAQPDCERVLGVARVRSYAAQATW